jgi:thymidylate kinase
LHISIEGIDGVGKTTTARLVAEQLGFIFVEKPLQYLFDEIDSQRNYLRIRDIVNGSDNRLFTSWFYGLSNIYLYEKFKGKNIITDRHLLSNYCWSGTNDSEEVFDLLVEKIGNPDYTFILYANEQTVLNRLKERDVLDSDIPKTQFIPVAYKKMRDFCERYNMPFMEIDSSTLATQEVVNIIVNKIQEVI